MFDLAYSEFLNTNQELRGELQDEIFINKSNEKKIRSLVKELKQCYRTISIQDNTIIAHEKEIEKLKSEISDLRKQLRVGSLKARIQIFIDKKISINALDMATTNLIVNVNRGLDRIENHIRGVGTSMQNPANVIDGIRSSLNTIRVTLQNITAERDQYQNILNDTNNWERDLRNQLRDNALNDENRQAGISYAMLETNIQMLTGRKDTQIAEHKRNAHRLTVRYNNDTERWRRRHIGCVHQAQNWKGQ
ncbi:hypothetical protein RhiirA4_485942 [Rhizophagus irregularis]|uniref:Uncharacterized protein n=1 Tax=Rhizophagus irregularis TaxID=588596 RepID=A0A2I1HQV1_9GLOM|nr:hypothetical protein RhiirA4_485942 [Rhizophagus irregularis]